MRKREAKAKTKATKQQTQKAIKWQRISGEPEAPEPCKPVQEQRVAKRKPPQKPCLSQSQAAPSDMHSIYSNMVLSYNCMMLGLAAQKQPATA